MIISIKLIVIIYNICLGVKGEPGIPIIGPKGKEGSHGEKGEKGKYITTVWLNFSAVFLLVILKLWFQFNIK